MLENLPKFHTLDIQYNGRYGVVHQLSPRQEHFEALCLEFSTAGRSPEIRIRRPNVDSGTSIDRIEEHDRSKPFTLLEGLRFGFDVLEGKKRMRLSYPEGGGLSVTIANAPLDHARVWASAGNDHEEWSWQLKDLYTGDSFEIEIVETDWCDPFPKVQKRTNSPKESHE